MEEECGRRYEEKEGERRDGKWFGGGMNKEGKIIRTDTWRRDESAVIRDTNMTFLSEHNPPLTTTHYPHALAMHQINATQIF